MFNLDRNLQFVFLVFCLVLFFVFGLCMNQVITKDNSQCERSLGGLDTHSQLVRNTFRQPFRKPATGFCWL